MTDVASQVSTSLDALTAEFDIIAHNLANANTTAYKRRCHGFAQALASQDETGEVIDPQSVLSEGYDFSQGNLVQTGRSLDVGLYGKGFFVIETPDGPLYTRHGVFHTNQNGQIVDVEGRMVAGNNGPLAVPEGTSITGIHISETGEISAGGIPLGQFQIVDFPEDEDQLIAIGLGCFYAPGDVEPVPAEEAIVRQGCQESSNVQIVDELVSMIVVTRTYEANVQLVNVTKDTTSSVIGIAMG